MEHRWDGKEVTNPRGGKTRTCSRCGASSAKWPCKPPGDPTDIHRVLRSTPVKISEVFKKDTNPKDAVGIRKAPLSTVSAGVMLELGTAMMEGAVKYGRHNYRVAGVRGSVYYDAAMRHLMAWWEGEDIDPDSGLSHIAKGIATLVVLRDAMMNDMWTDDRPPRMPDGWLTELNARAGDILDKHPEVKDAFTEKARTK